MYNFGDLSLFHVYLALLSCFFDIRAHFRKTIFKFQIANGIYSFIELFCVLLKWFEYVNKKLLHDGVVERILVE